MDDDILEDMENVLEIRASKFADKSSANDLKEGNTEDTLLHANSSTTEMETISISYVFVTNTSYVDTGSVNPLSALCLAKEQTIVEPSCENFEEPDTTNNDKDYQRENNIQ